MYEMSLVVQVHDEDILRFCLVWIKMYTQKQPHYRPAQAQSVPGGWGSQISRKAVVNLTHRPPLLIFIGGRVDPRIIMRPERLCQWKIPVTPSGIEPATFWLVEQWLNQLRHRVPQDVYMPSPYKC
jgi:hypothetical protein